MGEERERATLRPLANALTRSRPDSGEIQYRRIVFQ